LLSNGTYSFYAAAQSSSSCSGTPSVQGSYRLGGSLSAITAPYSCTALIQPGGDPNGYTFDHDYAGGGPVLPVTSSTGLSGVLQIYHGEWQGGTCGSGPCFYASLGMAISRDEGATFTNVFVNPSAYKQFLTTGNWPDQTVLVEEKRTSSNKGSLNKAAQFQTDLAGISVKVKDAARFPDKWAYYSFDSSAKTAHANPKAACWQCHHDQGGVDSTYVQFYPTLKPVAQKFGTLREAATGGEAY
jgi:hypothetical protein